MKRTDKNFLWLATMVVCLFVGTMLLNGCGSAGSGGEDPPTPTITPKDIGEDDPAPDPSDLRTVTVAIAFTDEQLEQFPELATWMAAKEAQQNCEAEGGQMCAQLVTGAPPVQIFGTLVSQDAWDDDTRWNPWDPVLNNVRDVSGFVVGNVLTMSFTVPVGRYYHLAYIVQGVFMFHNIYVEGVLIDSYCTLGDPLTSWTWGVAAFKVNRLSDASILVEPSEFCTELGYTCNWTLDGVATDPLLSDSPSVLPYDDGADGDDEGPIMLSSNLIYSPTAVEITNFNAGMARYEATFYLLEGMASRFGCYHPGREVTGSTDVPCADQLMTLTPLGGAGTCSTELWHMDNFQVLPADPYYEFTIFGVAGGCIDQDADNRRTTLGI